MRASSVRTTLNMRNHLDQLDSEIVRLGGKARDALPAPSSISNISNANGDSPPRLHRTLPLKGIIQHQHQENLQYC